MPIMSPRPINRKGSRLQDFLKSALAFIFSLTCAQIPTVLSSEFHVNTDTGRIEDIYGRDRLFHGLNVVMKGPPWHPHTDIFDPHNSFSEADINLIREWGMNVVRLAVMWPGVEPTQGNINTTYLKIMRSIVRKLHSAGIYTLIEFHQDLFSSQFCGEGIPGWVLSRDRTLSEVADPSISELRWRLQDLTENQRPPQIDPPCRSCELAAREAGSNLEINQGCQQLLMDFASVSRRSGIVLDQATGNELKGKCDTPNWFWFYFSHAVSKAFQDLYENRWGWADLLADYWKAVAKAFKEEQGVLGYELMNEPWAGNFYKNPLLLLPGIADRINLAPLYDKLHAAVRSVDSERIIFFESITFDDITCGFSTVPGGEEYRNMSILSYHYYRPPNLSPRQAFEERVREGKRLGCGTMLTEFFINREGSNGRWLAQKRHQFLSDWHRLLGAWKFCSSNNSFPSCDNEIKIGLEQACSQLEKFQLLKMSEKLKNVRKDAVEEVLAASDSHVQSWIGWEYKAFLSKTGSDIDESLFTTDGNINLNLAKKLARTFPQAVAGRIISFSFDPELGSFSLFYFVEDMLYNQAEGEILASVDRRRSDPCTEIFVHRSFHYPFGLDIEVSHNCLQVREDERIITVCHLNQCLRKVVEVTINRRNLS